MFVVSQIDHACNDPQLVADWYARLLGEPARVLGAHMFIIELGTVALHFPRRQDAGVAADDKGIDQVHLCSDESMAVLQQRCQAAGIAFEMLDFTGPEPVLCAVDPEGSPVILESSHKD